MVNNHFKDQLLDKFQKSHQIKLELFSDLKKIVKFCKSKKIPVICFDPVYL